MSAQVIHAQTIEKPTEIRHPADYLIVGSGLSAQFPYDADEIRQFVQTVQQVRQGLKCLAPPMRPQLILQHLGAVLTTIRYLNHTLQDVFDRCKLPKPAQTLLALQWPDFLLPPEKLSFYAWVVLFTGYQEGAFYPTQHFEHVINSLVQVIQDSGGVVRLNQEVIEFIVEGKTVKGVKAILRGRGDANDRRTHQIQEYTSDQTICNLDPKKAAKMVGQEKFSAAVKRRLNYDYSPSNYMAYCVVKDLNWHCINIYPVIPG